MSSKNGSDRPSGYVSIPVEIIRDPSNSTGGSGSHSRHNSPYRTLQNDNSFGGGFSDTPQWTSNSTPRFQPRPSPGGGYDRIITNSQFNQPFNDRPSYQTYQEPQYRQPYQRMYEPGSGHFSRSSEDLLSPTYDSMNYNTRPQFSSLIPPSFGDDFGLNSDFVHPSKHSNPLGRSFDALNDFPETRQSFPTTRPYPYEQYRQQEQQQPFYRSTYQTQHQPQFRQQQQQQQPSYANQTNINPNIVYTDEYGVPVNHYQPNTFQGTGSNVSNDRPRSNSQRGPSPARPPPTTTQQEEEPELKMAKDTDGPIPMPAPASYSSSPPTQTTDQQVPSGDATASTNVPSPPPPPPEPVRDPNTVALEKLEQLKETLDNFEKEVDKFTGSTRNDRAYKILDEQALKIMMRCDELVDVSADIKEKRKEMIRNVEKVLGKLESKVPATPAVEQNSNPIEQATTSTTESSVNNNNSVNVEKKSSSSSPKENISTSTTATEQSISV